VEKLIGKYQVFWCDGKVDNPENEGYRDSFNVHSYCQWDYIANVQDLCDKLDDPKISSNVIIISSGKYSEEII